MSLEEERIHAWFSLARTILSETGWEARKSGDLRSMVSHNYGNPMDLGKRAIEMMGFAWFVHGFPYHSCEYFLVLESQAAAASEGMQGYTGYTFASPTAVGWTFWSSFDFPSILIEARSMMAEANFPHHCRKLWGTMTEGMVFFLKMQGNTESHLIPNTQKPRSGGFTHVWTHLGVCFTLEGWDYFGLFGCIQWIFPIPTIGFIATRGQRRCHRRTFWSVQRCVDCWSPSGRNSQAWGISSSSAEADFLWQKSRYPGGNSRTGHNWGVQRHTHLEKLHFWKLTANLRVRGQLRMPGKQHGFHITWCGNEVSYVEGFQPGRCHGAPGGSLAHLALLSCNE